MVAPIGCNVIVPVPPSRVKVSVEPPDLPSIEAVNTIFPSVELSSVSIVTSPSIVTASLNVTVPAAAVPSV